MNQTLSSDESADEEEVFRDFDAETQLIIQTETLPKKSGDRYVLVYDTYKKWQIEHKSSLSSSEESNLVVYFKELSKKLKPPTLWSIWSMLKKTLNTRDNVDISRFQNLRSLIKKNSKGYKPKKSLVLKWDEIINFMSNAPDYIYLASKVSIYIHFINYSLKLFYLYSYNNNYYRLSLYLAFAVLSDVMNLLILWSKILKILVTGILFQSMKRKMIKLANS